MDTEAILKMPAATPPPNVIPNLVNPPNGNAGAVAFLIICLVISTLVVAIRVWSKMIKPRTATVSDVLEICALGCFVGVIWCGFRIWKTIGFFVEQYNVPVGTLIKGLFPFYLFPLLYGGTMMFAKTAILLEFIHLFVPTRERNKFWWICSFMIFVNISFYIICIVILQFYCKPIQKNWNRLLPGTCKDRRDADIAPAAFNLALDLMILLLPQKVIWSLHMNTRRKVGVSIVFSVGIIACICAGGRIAHTANIDYLQNITYDVSPVYLWTVAECTCAILVYCVPALPKALGELWLFQSLKTLYSSHIRSSRKDAGKSENSDNFRTFGQGSRTSNSYYKMSNIEPSQSDSVSDIGVARTEAFSVPGHDVESGIKRPDRGILRTLEVTTDVRAARQGNRNEGVSDRRWK